MQGLKNELRHYLSRTNFDERLQMKSEDLSKEAFQRMDTRLDLSLEKPELLSVINPKDYEEKYKDVLDKLGEAKYAIIEDVLWSVGSNGLLRNKIRTCVPAQHLNKNLIWVHDVEGHPESRSWLWAFNRCFYTREEDAKMLERINRLEETCEASLYAKRNRPKDRGLVGCLPLPDLVNSLVYVDFIDRQSYGQFDYCLMIVDSLSSFCQVVPCKKKIGGEQVLSLVYQHGIKHYGAMVRLHPDRDVGFTSETGWWRNTFKVMAVEVTFGQPYSPQSNGFCERKNGDYREEIMLLMHKGKSKNWPRLTDYATFVMNNRERGKTGYSPSDIFFGRRTWRLEMPFAHAGNQDVESWIQEQNRLAQTVQDQLRRKRTTRHKYLNRKRAAPKYLVGDYVLVHRNRFQGRTAAENENTLFCGPYLVTGVTGRGITARCSPTLGGEVNVAHNYLRQWPFSLSVNSDSKSDEFEAEAANEDEELEAEETDQRDVRDKTGQSLPLYDAKEMHAQGNYLVESILQVRYKRGWRFLVKWQGYGTADSTWEPVKAFVLDGGRVNEVFARFCMEHQPRYNAALKKCRELSQRHRRKRIRGKYRKKKQKTFLLFQKTFLHLKKIQVTVTRSRILENALHA